jgi:hypothetical protein
MNAISGHTLKTFDINPLNDAQSETTGVSKVKDSREANIAMA